MEQNIVCYLHYETAWQLLIATMLSAQCTDARVNIVTADLFQKYDTLEKFANADLKELEQDIKPTGFYHNKAKNIIACTKAAGRTVWRGGSQKPGGLDVSCGGRKKDSECHTGEYLPMMPV